MFVSILVDDWEILRLLGGKMPRWIFRGQPDASWSLVTSLERRAKAGLTPQRYLEGCERSMLRQFQRRAHLVIPSPPPESARLEWLSIIQHYGGPTRLLDFTHSMYVAAFFAVEQCLECDAAIWAVDGAYLTSRNLEDSNKKTTDEANVEHLRRADKILDGGSNEVDVLQVEPDRLNDRMSIQKGVFLFPSNIKTSFLTNLSAALGVRESLLASPEDVQMSLAEFVEKILADPSSFRAAKVVLSRRAHEDAIYDLAEMNINAATLFPGLEGFAKSLVHYLRMPAFVRYPERIKPEPK